LAVESASVVTLVRYPEHTGRALINVQVAGPMVPNLTGASVPTMGDIRVETGQTIYA
jgi:hypothetical protein